MRSTKAIISYSNLIYNLNRIRELAPSSEVMAIVKGNAYGHGAVPISKKLREAGVGFLAVAFAEEGEKLRLAGDTGNIVLLVPGTSDDYDSICNNNFQPLISTIEFAEGLNEMAHSKGITIKAHLFVGTGMNREGIEPKRALEFMNRSKEWHGLNIVGICTHFATSSSDEEFLAKQLRSFNKVRTELSEAGFEFENIHASNSGAILRHPEAHFNLIRPGIALYGYPPAGEMAEKYSLKPILKLVSSVALSRKVHPGESVGYDRLFITDKETRIVTIPIGYGDGYLKILTGKTQCLINGKRYDIVGTICMDVLMANTNDDMINIGDEVVLIGCQAGEEISALELAERAGTIVWDVLTSISDRVPRIYTEL